MLDTAVSGYVPYIFEEKPHLHNSFSGFTWFKNTIAFGGHTNFGAPPVFGGYEYEPMEMQIRKDIALKEKHNEALLLLNKIFSQQNYKMTVTDPPYANYSWVADLSIYSGFNDVHAENVIGRYTGKWMRDRSEDIKVIDISMKIKFNLIRFSVFRLVPLILRNFTYDSGKWMAVDGPKEYFPMSTLNNYVALDILPELTEIMDSEADTYNVLSNDLPHRPHFLRIPDYVPAANADYKGGGPFSNFESYHANMASLLLLGKWFDFLRENNVYDNSRIIIVSDHGNPNIKNVLPDDLVLPNGDNLVQYTAFLLAKDFDASGVLSTDNSFMTNADVPLMALKGIVQNPVNPWTGKSIKANKENGVTITTSHEWSVDKHPKYNFYIKPDEWLYVRDNIYDSRNWSKVNK